MDWYDDIQVEELINFDHKEEDLEDLVEEPKNFNMKNYLNSNIDYWNELPHRHCQRPVSSSGNA